MTEVAKANYNAAERRAMAKKGWALPDGSFPIANASDLKDAIRLVGNGKDPGKAKAHIIKRAKALNLTKSLPDGWTSGSTAKASNSISDLGVPKSTSMSYKELHDRWLELQPEGASHDEDSCVLCQLLVEAGNVGDSMADKTYTEDDFKAAVAAAVKPLEDRLAELEGDKAAEAFAAKLAEVVDPLQDKVNELQSALDVKEAEATAAKAEVEAIKSYLEAEKTAAEETAAKEARKADRVAKVAENASYKDEYVAEHADRWAAMEDADFDAFIDNLKAAGVKPGEKSEKDDEIPGKTVLDSSRETANKDESALAGLLDLRRAGFDSRRNVV